MSDTPKPPDIKTTRLRLVIAGTIVGAPDKIMTLDPDCKVAKLRFTENVEHPGPEPVHECDLMTEFEHGTVDEIVEDFRRKMTNAFYAWTRTNPSGTGPAAGVSQEEAEKRWAELELLQVLLSESDCSWPNGGDSGVRFIPFTPRKRVAERKAREVVAKAKERSELLAQAGLDDAG